MLKSLKRHRFSTESDFSWRLDVEGFIK